MMRVTAHKFSEERFMSPSYEDPDENDEGDVVNFVAADEAGWKIDHPAPKPQQVVHFSKGDFVYMVKVKQDGNYRDKIESRGGTFCEVGQVINFYKDPGKAHETIWMKYHPVWRQSQLIDCTNNEDLPDLVAGDLLLTKDVGFVRLKWIEPEHLTVFTTMEEYDLKKDEPHHFVLR